MKPKIGLVLSGGAARGLAHVGVIKILEECGIRPDIIAGNSMGGVIGALYAKDKDIKAVEKFVLEFKYTKLFRLFDLKLFNDGIFKGERIKNYLNDYLCNINFEDLKIPLSVNAININNGEEIIINKGNVTDGLRATISLPGVFEPYNYHGKLLVDGMITNPLPINLLKNHKLDMIICSSVLTKPVFSKNNKIRSVLNNSYIIMCNELFKSKLKDQSHDFLIEPNVNEIEFYDFMKRKELIKLGEKACLEQIKNINKKYRKIKKMSFLKNFLKRFIKK